jgi:lactate dehydrogenase-like 2-hydroxyacid dehydrogenase
MKIVILDGYTANPGDLSWSELEALGDVTVYDRTKPEDTVARAADAEVVLTNKVVLGRKEIEQLPHLQYIGVLATGYNVVDIAAAHEHGITVTNVPAYSTESVAQMVFAHLLTVTNRTEHYALQNREGRWSKNPDFCYWDTSLTELAGKTMGIVGLGNIGSARKNSDAEFACYPHPDTRLVLEGDIGGTRCFYPIPLKMLAAGKIISMDITLRRFGVHDPDIPVESDAVSLDIVTAPWEERETQYVNF